MRPDRGDKRQAPRRLGPGKLSALILALAASGCSAPSSPLVATDAGDAGDADVSVVATRTDSGAQDATLVEASESGGACVQANGACTSAADCCSNACVAINNSVMQCSCTVAGVTPPGVPCCSLSPTVDMPGVGVECTRGSDGAPCRENAGCSSELCVNGVCAPCIGDHQPNPSGNDLRCCGNGETFPSLGNLCQRITCASNADCFSGDCYLGMCAGAMPGGPCSPLSEVQTGEPSSWGCWFPTGASTNDCPADAGTCPMCARPNQACQADGDCCLGTCSTNAASPSSKVCTCLASGAAATSDLQCCSGGAANGVCGAGAICVSNSDCNNNGLFGSPYNPCVNNQCACGATGAPCGTGYPCCMGAFGSNCVGPDQTCSGGGYNAPCTDEGVTGGQCAATCTNGFCSPLPYGYYCEHGDECRSGICATFTAGGPSNYCTAQMDGEPCTVDTDCGSYPSSKCVNGVCACVSQGCYCGTGSGNVDNCGNPCTACPAGKNCVPIDNDVPACCAGPQCPGMECGVDSCSGLSCGSCGPWGATCVSGKCVGGSCRPLNADCSTSSECCDGLTCVPSNGSSFAYCLAAGGGGGGGSGDCTNETANVEATPSSNSLCQGYYAVTNNSGVQVSCGYMLSDGTQGCFFPDLGFTDCAIYGTLQSFTCVDGDQACENSVGCGL